MDIIQDNIGICDDNDDAIRVEMFDWYEGVGQQRIYTLGLGPCIGVVLFHTKKKRALVGHFPFRDDSYKDMLAHARQNYRHFRNINAYLAGGSLDGKEATVDSAVANFRQQVRSDLVELGIPSSEIKVRWSKPNHVMNISVLASTGRVTIETWDLDELP